jgi:hypothetical protein
VYVVLGWLESGGGTYSGTTLGASRRCMMSRVRALAVAVGCAGDLTSTGG